MNDKNLECSSGHRCEFIISAPSGAGKTTLFHQLKQMVSLEKVVSYTTRTRRQGENPGQDYHFVTIEQFREKIKEDFFLEWADVYGNYYGTPQSSSGTKAQNLIYEVDVKGFISLRKYKSDITSIFIAPPSVNVLRERLLKRQPAMPEHELSRRLSCAQEEIQHASSYDYVICNSELSKALENLKLIF